ncbi:hypothetical protein PR048_026179 [Dryococelus australis]|uniref:Uncharacterized protein n=1 Tax=Dryococelus australis TaxID=614101 RepID=A0ABQ9GKP7_9NEOP|nr:hypothetical protein PR048_026179 [Dryococelus australis]
MFSCQTLSEQILHIHASFVMNNKEIFKLALLELHSNIVCKLVKSETDPRGNAVSKVKKRGSDTGDTNTHALSAVVIPPLAGHVVSARDRAAQDSATPTPDLAQTDNTDQDMLQPIKIDRRPHSALNWGGKGRFRRKPAGPEASFGTTPVAIRLGLSPVHLGGRRAVYPLNHRGPSDSRIKTKLAWLAQPCEFCSASVYHDLITRQRSNKDIANTELLAEDLQKSSLQRQFSYDSVECGGITSHILFLLLGPRWLRSPWWEASRLTTQPPLLSTEEAKRAYMFMKLSVLAENNTDFFWHPKYGLEYSLSGFEKPMRMERQWNARAREMGDPRENQTTSGIVRRDPHTRKSGAMGKISTNRSALGIATRDILVSLASVFPTSQIWSRLIDGVASSSSWRGSSDGLYGADRKPALPAPHPTLKRGRAHPMKIVRTLITYSPISIIRAPGEEDNYSSLLLTPAAGAWDQAGRFTGQTSACSGKRELFTDSSLPQSEAVDLHFVRGLRSIACRKCEGRFRRVFPGHSPFNPPFHSTTALFLPYFTLISCQNLAVEFRPQSLKSSFILSQEVSVCGPSIGTELLLISSEALFTHFIILGAAVAERLVCSPPTNGEPGSIPCRVTLGFSHVGIVPDDPASRRVFSGISRFPPILSFRRCSIITYIALIGSQDHAVILEQRVAPNSTDVRLKEFRTVFNEQLIRVRKKMSIACINNDADIRLAWFRKTMANLNQKGLFEIRTPVLLDARIGKFREFNDLWARLRSPVYDQASDDCSLAAAPQSNQCYLTPGCMGFATCFLTSLLLVRVILGVSNKL